MQGRYRARTALRRYRYEHSGYTNSFSSRLGAHPIPRPVRSAAIVSQVAVRAASAYAGRMKKWEYLQIMMTTKAVHEGHSRLIILSKGNQHAQVGAGKRLIDLLCELGEEGWELASVVDLSSVDELRGEHDLRLTNSSLLLKRPLGA
jgi:hypothetical protein